MYNIFGRHGRRKVNVPNLSGRTRSQAQSDLTSIGLNYSESSTNTSDSNLTNLIQNQGTSSGAVVLIGDTVSFVYYNYIAPPNFPNFPNFVAPNFPNFVAPNFPNFVAPNFPNFVAPNFPNFVADFCQQCFANGGEYCFNGVCYYP